MGRWLPKEGVWRRENHRPKQPGFNPITNPVSIPQGFKVMVAPSRTAEGPRRGKRGTPVPRRAPEPRTLPFFHARVPWR